jgi:ribosomal protein L11 methyltransferase
MHPDRLWVYECRAERSPPTEPERAGYLGLWPEPPYYYFFFDRQVDAWLAGWLSSNNLLRLNARYHLDYLQWQQLEHEELKAGSLRIRFVAPGAPPPEEDRVLHVIPGLSFGTGLHPTTRGCLLLVDRIFRHSPGLSVVDLGTGSGILALACTALGARRTWAVECNPLAVREAHRNVRANRREDQIACIAADGLNVLRGSRDLLLMNLEAASLPGVLQGPEWRRYPRAVLSGFLESQWQEFEPMIPSAFRESGRVVLDGWLTVHLYRPPGTEGATGAGFRSTG